MSEIDAQQESLRQWATQTARAELRDRFAMAALTAMPGQVENSKIPATSLAAAAYHIADAMLAERDRNP